MYNNNTQPQDPFASLLHRPAPALPPPNLYAYQQDVSHNRNNNTNNTLPPILPRIAAATPISSLPPTSQARPRPSRPKYKIKTDKTAWTADEDNLLRLAVQLYGDRSERWTKIAACVPGRTNKMCRKRWFHSLDPNLRKGPWTEEEDELLRKAVEKHNRVWCKVAESIPGRTDDQCAKRWKECLDPEIDHTEWTDHEDALLVQKYSEYGSQWQQIAQFFQGRPGLHCRNRWRKIQRLKKAQKDPSIDMIIITPNDITTPNSSSSSPHVSASSLSVAALHSTPQNILQPNLQSNTQSNLSTNNVQSNVQQQPNTQPHIPSHSSSIMSRQVVNLQHSHIHPTLQQPNMQSRLSLNNTPNLSANFQSSLQPNLQPNLQSNLQPNLQSNMQPNLQPNLQPSMQPNLQSNMQPNLQSNMQPNLQSNMQPNLQPNLQSNMQPNLQPNLQSNMQPNLQPNLQSSLQPNLQSNLQPNLQSNLQPNLNSKSNNYVSNYSSKSNNSNLRQKSLSNIQSNLSANLSPNLTNNSASSISSMSSSIAPPIDDDTPDNMSHLPSTSIASLLSPPSSSVVNNQMNLEVLADQGNSPQPQPSQETEVETNVKAYGCGVAGCEASFAGPNGLYYHMKAAHPSVNSSDKPYRCALPGCPKAYKNINGLQYHIDNAKGSSGHKYDTEEGTNDTTIKPFKCPVAGCKNHYSSANGLQYHQKIVHSKDSDRCRGSRKVNPQNNQGLQNQRSDDSDPSSNVEIDGTATTSTSLNEQWMNNVSNDANNLPVFNVSNVNVTNIFEISQSQFDLSFNNSRFKCLECDKNFNTPAELSNHANNDHSTHVNTRSNIPRSNNRQPKRRIQNSE